MKRRGNCYVTCEALYHLLGGKAAGYTPRSVRHEGDVHWYLVLTTDNNCVDEDGTKLPRSHFIVDPTCSQFATPVPYEKGRARGFLTKKPSKRARAMMELLVWQGIVSDQATRAPGKIRTRS